MITATQNTNGTATTPYRAVVPFYAYAALCLLATCIILFFSAEEFTGHYFQPRVLAVTHLMALCWATMIILGASHQLVPVLIESELYSDRLAIIIFLLAAAGIPLLAFAFFTFNMGLPLITGGVLINLAVITYVINLGLSFTKKHNSGIQALFIFTSSLWLLLTTLLGLLLAINFTQQILQKDSLHFLSLHAHIGLAGWFLLLVTGVASKLIPMFMISKHEDNSLLQGIYLLINAGIISFVVQFQYFNGTAYLLPVLLITSAIALFGYYCFCCYKKRIRKRIDRPVKLSLASVAVLFFALLILFIISGVFLRETHQRLVMVYGITIFFGWLTAIIFGMTFKTLPFIVWNKLRLNDPTSTKANDPRVLFKENDFRLMSIAYLGGLVLLVIGVCTSVSIIIKISSLFLIFAAIMYNKSVWMMLLRKKM